MARPTWGEQRADTALDDADAYLDEAERLAKVLIVRLDIISHEYGKGNIALRRVAAPALEQVAELTKNLHALRECLEKGEKELKHIRAKSNRSKRSD